MELLSVLKLPTQIPLIFWSTLWLLNCSTSCSGGHVLFFSCFKKVQKNLMVMKERILLFDFKLGKSLPWSCLWPSLPWHKNLAESLSIYLWYLNILHCILVRSALVFFYCKTPTQFYFQFKLEVGSIHLTIHNIQFWTRDLSSENRCLKFLLILQMIWAFPQNSVEYGKLPMP